MASQKHTTPAIQLDFSFAPAEEWRPVVGYEGLYEVSNLGRVRSVDRYVRSPNTLSGQRRERGRTLRSRQDKDGYLSITLSKDGHAKTFRVHRMVLTSFYGACPDDHVTNHRDGNRQNNAVSNLEWVTQQQNWHHALGRGTKHIGEMYSTTKLTEQQVRDIRLLAKAGATNVALAKQFGVYHTNIWMIVHRETWKDLPEE